MLEKQVLGTSKFPRVHGAIAAPCFGGPAKVLAPSVWSFEPPHPVIPSPAAP